MVAGRLQEKNAYLYIVLSYKDENGKRREPWFKTGLQARGNRRKAEDMLKDYRERFDIKTGKLVEESLELEQELGTSGNFSATNVEPKDEKVDMLFGDYLLQWVEDMRNSVELTTYAGYKRNITSVIAPYFNERGITLAKLNGHLIDEFYREQLKRVKGKTVIRYHANIRTALEEAFKNDLVPYNYADKAHRPKEEEYIAAHYDRDELMELFEVVKGKKIEFAVVIAAYYGFRREEVVGLKWSNIDFRNKTISIRHTVTECSIDGKVIMVAKDRAKTKKSIRTLPLVLPIEQMLLRMKEKEEIYKREFGDKYNSSYDEYIYKDPNGELVKPGFVTQNFSNQVIAANPQLRKIRFHDLRHSCATLLRSQGVPMEDIQKWLGHSQITTTEKLYAHFEYKTHISSAEKITSAFDK